MEPNKKNPVENPFFVQFLEDQEVAKAHGGIDRQTLKYPSDRDETVTLKYPSDDDEGYVDV